MTRTNADPAEIAIPATLNCALLLLAYALAAALLYAASHATSWIWLVLAAVGFSYVNNTVFALMHEATHDILHPSKRINDWMGRFAAALFPTAYSLQRSFHLTHHRNNRSELEQFDYLRPHDNRFLKLAQWYSILTGLYWVFPPIGCIIYFLFPGAFRIGLLRAQGSPLAQQTSADAYLGSAERVPGWTIRMEILLGALVHAALILALDLTLAGWACCYAAFAVNWSSLQYADHAWSPLNAREGAWNLRVNGLVRLFFLNYHHHLAHHQNPKVPWIHLPKFVAADSPRPSFLGIYLQMWRGPRPFPGTERGGPTRLD